MKEALYLEAEENRRARTRLQERINQAKDAKAKITITTLEPLLITLPEHVGGGTCLLSHQILYDALEDWIEKKLLRAIELDQAFSEL